MKPGTESMGKLPLLLALAVLVFAAGGCRGFQFLEATVDAIQLGFKNGSVTSTALVRFYLDQIARLNPKLHAVIEVNPDALAQAARADAERSSGCTIHAGCGGALHGIPVLLKDNIATRDRLNTTAGSFALLGSVVRRDAGVVARLRRAGAVVLGKANLDEWANYRSDVDLNGWSPRGGQALNPYVLSAYTCGSSTGSAVAVAANMAAVTLGTETEGSIICPSAFNSAVGIKPTVGLTSRSGVVPITPRQDTVGPICRTVTDAVHVLDAIVGFDELDAEATGATSKYIPADGYKQFLRTDGLRGKRIGIPNGYFTRSLGKEKLMAYHKHFSTMRKHGAVVVKNVNISTNLTDLLEDLFINLRTAAAGEFKSSMNAYLSDLLYSPVRSVRDIIAFNIAHPIEEKLKEFGQYGLLLAENTTGIGPKERAAARELERINAMGLEKMMREHRLDAFLTPGASAANLLSIGGHPAIDVPAGYDKQGAPFGICFGGLRGYEPRLVQIAYAFEQATRVRRPPTFKP